VVKTLTISQIEAKFNGVKMTDLHDSKTLADVQIIETNENMVT